MKRFLPYFRLLRPVRGHFIVALVLGVIHGLTSGFGMPLATEKVFPVIFSEPRPSDWVLLAAVSLLPLAFLLRGLSGFLNSYLITYCGVQVLKAIQMQVYDKLQRLPLEFYDRNRTGDLMARVMGDTSQLQHTITTTSNDLIRKPITLVGAIGYLAYLALRNEDLLFLLFWVSVIPLFVLPVRFTGRKLLRRAEQTQAQSGTVNSFLSENLGAVKEIRLFNLQESQSAGFRAALDTFQRYAMKVVKYSLAIGPTIEFLSTIGAAAAVFYAAKSGLTLERLMPMMVALFYSYQPIRSFGETHNAFKRGLASLDRIETVLNHPEMIPDPPDPVEITRVQGEVDFRSVSFRYGQEPVLVEIDERVAPGEIVALVGPSGAGKSTFANLIPRLYEVRAGAVCIDGIDVRRLRKSDLRSQIATVPQEPVLFNDTIRNNILIGRPHASHEEVIRAAQEAYAHDFIVSLHDSYDTRVGERGTRLSGGQKQRIALARAFLKNAPILILDEATSNLDSESEAMIQKALTHLVRGRTTLIIAHRFSTLKIADRILVFDGGRIVARGTHGELFSTSPRYRALYEKQL